MGRDEPSCFSSVLLQWLGDANIAPDSLPDLPSLRLSLLKPVRGEELETHRVDALPLRGLGRVIYPPAAAFWSPCRDDDPHCKCGFMVLGSSFHIHYSLSLQTRQKRIKIPIRDEDQGMNCPRQDTAPLDSNSPASSLTMWRSQSPEPTTPAWPAGLSSHITGLENIWVFARWLLQAKGNVLRKLGEGTDTDDVLVQLWFGSRPCDRADPEM